MLFEYDSTEAVPIPNFKGGEGFLLARLYTDEMGKILRGTLPAGSTVGTHAHEDSCEVIYVISGIGHSTVDGVEEQLRAGMSTYCPKGSTHNLVNDGQDPLEFFAVVPEQ